MNQFPVFALLLASSIYAHAAGHSAIDPVPRPDNGWKQRQASFNERVKEVGKKAQLIFIGDSITHSCENDGKEVWAERFAKYDAINLGIGGDRTQHVLWRLDNGNLEGLSPKAAVLMIGTNNSNGEDNTPEQIADGVRAIVEKLHNEVVKALAVPSVQERLSKIGVEPMPMTIAEFEAFFRNDVAANLALVKAANIPVQ